MKRDYYSDYEYGTPKDAGRSLSMRLFDGAMTLLSLVAAVAMVVTLLVPWLNPAHAWFLPVLGLVAPATYVVTVVLALYWVIRWRWVRAAGMLVLVFIGFFKISLFYRPEFRKVYDTEVSERGTIKVMTYNVRSFYGEDGGNSADDVMRLIAEENPDIVCLQEYNLRLAEQSQQNALLAEQYETTLVDRMRRPDSLYNVSQVIWSKYRILHSGTLLTPGVSVWADLLIDDDTVRVCSNHLRSTAITAADSDFLTGHRFLSDTASEDKIRSIVTRLRENSVLRAAEVDSIRLHAGEPRGRRIVCGDFNDTPMSYVYNRMSEGLNDAFSECGSGYSYTFRGFYNTLRIDYVLSSPEFETLVYEVRDVDYSDHLPVLVRLRKNRTNN